MEEIQSLLKNLLAKAISAREFCDSYERVWNFEFDKNSLTGEDFKALEILFDEVVLHCPLPREQWEYPRYRDDLEIEAAAERALSSINREL